LQLENENMVRIPINIQLNKLLGNAFIGETYS